MNIKGWQFFKLKKSLQTRLISFQGNSENLNNLLVYWNLIKKRINVLS